MIALDAIVLDSFRSDRALLADLVLQLEARGRTPHDLASVTFFVAAADAQTHRERERFLRAAIDAAFGEDAPPVSLVAQAPERRTALEALFVDSPSAHVERRIAAGTRYTLVREGETRQVHAAGIVAETRHGDVADSAREAFARMEAILESEGLTFGHVVRQWNYMESMLTLRGDERGARRQVYQVLNDVRKVAYARSSFPTGFPASTGIGQDSGGILLEFLALEGPEHVVVSPVSNPRQIDAHHYSHDVLVGTALEDVHVKAAPCFERAKRVTNASSETIFVSGTASILGERSVGLGDVTTQTRTTLENIAELTDREPLSWFRAYVKHARDVPLVRKRCERAYPRAQGLYLEADVCRDELLVEIEGVAVKREGTRS